MADWSAEAACLDNDPEMFFPPGEGQMSWARIDEAKEVCAGCRVAVPCLELALATDAQYGVWGGLTPGERKQIRRARAWEKLSRQASPVPATADAVFAAV